MTSENLCEPSPILAPLGEILCERRRLWRHGSRAPADERQNPAWTYTAWFTMMIPESCGHSKKEEMVLTFWRFSHVQGTDTRILSFSRFRVSTVAKTRAHSAKIAKVDAIQSDLRRHFFSDRELTGGGNGIHQDVINSDTVWICSRTVRKLLTVCQIFSRIDAENLIYLVIYLVWPHQFRSSRCDKRDLADNQSTKKSISTIRLLSNTLETVDARLINIILR